MPERRWDCRRGTPYIHAEKYGTEDKSNTEITKTKHNSEKAMTTKHSKTKLACFSRFL